MRARDNENAIRRKVLIFIKRYIPGVKSGGPIQSIKNLVNTLSDDIDFYILTSDRDSGDDRAFVGIKTDEWIKSGKSNYFYASTSRLTWRRIVKITSEIEYDAIYLNGFFPHGFNLAPILLKKVGKIKECNIIVAPRGEFSPGALGLKRMKKRLYIELVKILGIYKDVTWHASTDTEKDDIERVFGKNSEVKIATNLTEDYKGIHYDKTIDKKVGALKIVFISRIHPSKNLKRALEFLYNIAGEIEFDIYGPITDKSHWKECRKAIETLPENIRVAYKGLVAHDEVIGIFKMHQIFLFPTLGENFGHVIAEALIAGCPVITSDQTPWRGLEEKQVGWDISLKDERGFIDAIQRCVNMTDAEYRIFSENAFKYGKSVSNKEEDIDSYLDLFLRNS